MDILHILYAGLFGLGAWFVVSTLIALAIAPLLKANSRGEGVRQ